MTGSIQPDPLPLGDELSLIPVERTLLDNETIPIRDDEAIEILSGCLLIALCHDDRPPEPLLLLRAGRVVATPGFFGKPVVFPARCELHPEGQVTCLVYSKQALQTALIAAKWGDAEVPPSAPLPIHDARRRRRDAVGARMIHDAASLASWQQKALSTTFELIRALFERESSLRAGYRLKMAPDAEPHEALKQLAEAQIELTYLKHELQATREERDRIASTADPTQFEQFLTQLSFSIQRKEDAAGVDADVSLALTERKLAAAEGKIAVLTEALSDLEASLLTQERMTNVAVASAISAERQRQQEQFQKTLAERDQRIADLEDQLRAADQQASLSARRLKKVNDELYQANTDVVSLRFSLDITNGELEAARRTLGQKTPQPTPRKSRRSAPNPGPSKRSGRR